MPATACIHPFVLMSVTDQYNRVAEDTKKRFVGIFGSKSRSSDLEINELFKRYTLNPILMVVDVKSYDAKILTDAYFAIEEIKKVNIRLLGYLLLQSILKNLPLLRTVPPLQRRTFVRVSSKIVAEEAKETGVGDLLRDIEESTFSIFSTGITYQLGRLGRLEKVINGKFLVNHRIIYTTCNLLPNLEKSEMVNSFNTKTNGQLLSIYSSSMIRAAIVLHHSVNNKIDDLESENVLENLEKEVRELDVEAKEAIEKTEDMQID